MNEYHKDTLSNGLRVVTVEMPHLHSVEMMCYVGAGGRHEPPELAGISHFLEHILFRGTADYPTSRELEQAFENIGGAVNASTDSETTVYHARFHPDHVPEGAALFASMLRRPLWREVETERKIILEEALEDLNEKGEDINPDNLTARLLWPGHPLGHPTIGTRETIGRIREAELRGYHQAHYSPANTLIVAAGRVSREGLLHAVAESFGTWSGGPVREPLPFAPASSPHGPASLWVKDSASQTSIQIAFRMPGRNDPRAVFLRVLRRVLSAGGTSRLMMRLREDLGLTYSVEAGLSLFAETGCFTVDLSVAPESLPRAVREVLNIFEELCREPVGEEEMAKVVRTFLFDLDFSRDHIEEMAVRYGWGELVGSLRTVAQDRREIASVTSHQLLSTARELFVPENLRAAFTGPFSARDRREVEKMLKGFRGRDA